VAAEYQEHFGEHAYDEQGNYIGPSVEHSPEADEAWAEYYAETGEAPEGGGHPEGAPPVPGEAPVAEAVEGAVEAEAGDEPAVEAEAEPVEGTEATDEV